jgi:hypothetical protein
MLSLILAWKRIFESCEQFFKHNRLEQTNERKGDTAIPNFTISDSATVVQALEKMVATRAHRVWVITGVNELVGLVSLSSIMPLLLV